MLRRKVLIALCMWLLLSSCDDGQTCAPEDVDCVLESFVLYSCEEHGTQICASSYAVIGQTYGFEGDLYLVVDETILRNMTLQSSTSPLIIQEIEAQLKYVVTTYVTDMSVLFGKFGSPIGKNLNPDISRWDTSNVTTMSGMFNENQLFDYPLNNWNVSKVTDMSFMFSVTVFNQPIEHWDVGNVEDMNHMFSQSAFNQPIGGWNIGKVDNMSFMFHENAFFNQPIGDWDVSGVINMSSMFNLTTQFNQPLDKWKVGNVTDMAFMFYQASAFDQNISQWNVSGVINMGTGYTPYTKFCVDTKMYQNGNDSTYSPFIINGVRTCHGF